jgi:hypothetical protein
MQYEFSHCDMGFWVLGIRKQGEHHFDIPQAIAPAPAMA